MLEPTSEVQESAATVRRPSRVNTSAVAGASQQVNNKRGKSVVECDSSKLKCSTISRVPSAKSRLKLPVASMTTSKSTNDSRVAAAVAPEAQKPSRLARSVQCRPTSLGLDTRVSIGGANRASAKTAATNGPSLYHMQSLVNMRKCTQTAASQDRQSKLFHCFLFLSADSAN